MESCKACERSFVASLRATGRPIPACEHERTCTNVHASGSGTTCERERMKLVSALARGTTLVHWRAGEATASLALIGRMPARNNSNYSAGETIGPG